MATAAAPGREGDRRVCADGDRGAGERASGEARQESEDRKQGL